MDIALAASGFDLDPDRVWLNASHQGPLPTAAAKATIEAVRWKQRPHRLATPALFEKIPSELRSAIAGLLSVPVDEVVLANSSSYGIHLLANGLDLGPGDEIVVAANDFPSDVLPWLTLRDAGVNVRQINPGGNVLSADEVAAALTDATKVVCLTWVHSLSGEVIDLDAIGALCRSKSVLFVVNASQGVGGIEIEPHAHPIDALTSVGFKYLCGPYGTGFTWLSPETQDRLTARKFYWLASMSADDLAAPNVDLDSIEPPSGARRHDIFGTANFFNFAAFVESIKFVADIGVDAIHRHNLALSNRLLDGLDTTQYEVGQRGPTARQSAILFLRPTTVDIAESTQILADGAIGVATRAGQIRIAPHMYNTDDDIDRAVEVLN